MKKDKLLPLAAMERIMKSVGAERVSNGAMEELKTLLEQHADQISKKAIQRARHSGRVTVKAEDFKSV